MTDGSAVILLLRMTVSLTVVLGLIVWAARFLNRRGGGLVGRPKAAVPVTVLGRHSLSRHASLSVVQVGESILVLGVTDAEVSLLREVDPATLPTPDDERSQAEPGAAVFTAGTEPQDVPNFATVLANTLPVRRAVKRQAEAARMIVERVAGPDSRMGGRHRG